MTTQLNMLISDTNAETLSIIHSYLLKNEDLKSKDAALAIVEKIKLFQKGNIELIESREELLKNIISYNSSFIFKHSQKFLVVFFILHNGTISNAIRKGIMENKE